jgi:hypothetical protein
VILMRLSAIPHRWILQPIFSELIQVVRAGGVDDVEILLEKLMQVMPSC